MIHGFNPLIHKSLYRVGVYASEGEDVAFELYDTLFAAYLTETAGQRWNPPIQFELIPVTLTSLRELAASEQVDFLFASSAVFSCMATESNAQALATIINRRVSRGYEYDLDVYGGVMFVLKDNQEINTIADFKDRTVGAGSITAMGGGQTQFYELYKHGISFVADLKQVVFTKDERLTVQGLLDGDFEIGFARTDQIERHTMENGQHLADDTFKIINPQTHTLQDGRLFPFVSSTGLHPEWPVAALEHVNPTVAKEVQDALLAIRDHALSMEMREELRCDTTDRIAQFAWEATRKGSFVGFRTALSYFQVRTKQEGAGFIHHANELGDLRCIDGDTLYEDIHCPTGHYKVTREEFQISCALKGLDCKEGYECFCQPCIAAFEVDVYQYHNDDATDNDETILEKQKGCSKMTLCGTVQQRHRMVFHVVDNRERENPQIDVVMHIRDTDVHLNATRLDPYVYEIAWSEEQVGVGIMEIFFDGEQIPESPLRVQVIQRDCNADFGDRGLTPSSDGTCVCGENTLDIHGQCVTMAFFAAAASVFALLILGIATLLFVRHKIEKSDELWKIDAEELHLDDPVEVIGQGSFGVVLLAVRTMPVS
jgi:ABC-type phosphate/phosphonate transport system substrate-binding protein